MKEQITADYLFDLLIAFEIEGLIEIRNYADLRYGLENCIEKINQDIQDGKAGKES